MRKLGFYEKWISIVMRSVPLVKYAIRINGQLCGQIWPSRDVRIRDVEIKTDSLEIFNAVQGLASPSSFVANVLARIMVQASFLRQCKFSHTKRQGNVSAHVLAQHAKFVKDYVAWLEECPSILEYVCAHDRLVFERSDI